MTPVKPRPLTVDEMIVEIDKLDAQDVELSTKLITLEGQKQEIVSALAEKDNYVTDSRGDRHRTMPFREFAAQQDKLRKRQRNVHDETQRLATQRAKVREVKRALTYKVQFAQHEERCRVGDEITRILASEADDPEALLRAAELLLNVARAELGPSSKKLANAITTYLDSLEDDD